MDEDMPEKTEEEEFNTGPLSVLMMSVKKQYTGSDKLQKQQKASWTS